MNNNEYGKLLNKLVIAGFFLVIACLLFGGCNRCYAINPLDEIAPTDKQLHFFVTYTLTDVMTKGWKWEWWQSGLAIEAIGIVKEQVDVACGGKWDNVDRRATRAGWFTYQIVNYKF